MEQPDVFNERVTFLLKQSVGGTAGD